MLTHSILSLVVVFLVCQPALALTNDNEPARNSPIRLKQRLLSEHQYARQLLDRVELQYIEKHISRWSLNEGGMYQLSNPTEAERTYSYFAFDGRERLSIVGSDDGKIRAFWVSDEKSLIGWYSTAGSIDSETHVGRAERRISNVGIIGSGLGPAWIFETHLMRSVL